MKNSKISFASIIAIMAATLTLAAKADALITSPPLPDCYIPSPTVSYKTACTDPITTFSAGSRCSSSAVVNAPGKHLFGGISDANKILADDLETECPAGGAVCCIFVEVDPAPCRDQPEITLNGVTDKWRITSVRCRL